MAVKIIYKKGSKVKNPKFVINNRVLIEKKINANGQGEFKITRSRSIDPPNASDTANNSNGG